MKQHFWVLAGVLAVSHAYATGNQASGTVRPEVSVKDLNQNPEKFAGQEVVVTGKIDRLEGGNSFILDGKGLFNDKILVVVDKRQQAEKRASDQQAGMAAPVIKERQRVQLTGRVEELGITKIEETYKPGLRPEVRAEFHGTVMPVLIVSPTGIKPQS